MNEHGSAGLESLVDRYRSQFRIAENTDHYREPEYKEAEKRYVKYCLLSGKCQA
jgi:hypothetical protein